LKILISGGGTAGHINPALAIADYAKKHVDAEILFIGTEKGLEKTLVEREGYNIKYIDVSGLIRSLTPKNIVVLAKYLKAIGDCKKIIKEFKPDVVVGTGGYVCAPAISAAASLGIPSIIHEQNVFPGVTVKMAAKKADCIAISFNDTLNYMKKQLHSKCELTGNPLDDAMLCVDKAKAREKLSMDDRPFIIMIGGSLGAERLNEAMTDFVNSCDKEAIYFVSSAGKRYYDKVIEKIDKEKLGENIKVLPFTDKVPELMSISDLVVTKPGGLTTSESLASSLPIIVINPIPGQEEENAEFLEKSGAAIWIKKNSDPNEIINSILGDENKLKNMKENSIRLAKTHATEDICKICLNGKENKND